MSGSSKLRDVRFCHSLRQKLRSSAGEVTIWPATYTLVDLSGLLNVSGSDWTGVYKWSGDELSLVEFWGTGKVPPAEVLLGLWDRGLVKEMQLAVDDCPTVC